jgi:hypothetical protein
MFRGDKLTIELLRPYKRILALPGRHPWPHLHEFVILEIAPDNSAILILYGHTDGKATWWTDEDLAYWKFYTGLEVK